MVKLLNHLLVEKFQMYSKVQTWEARISFFFYITAGNSFKISNELAMGIELFSLC